MSKKNKNKFFQNKQADAMTDKKQAETVLNENSQDQEVNTEDPTNNTEDVAEKTPQENDTDKKIKELESQVADYKDKYLRQVAEFDNYRKRTLKEKADLILNGGEKVISSLLPILDDFERAQKNLENSDDIKALSEGVDLIFKKFVQILESNGLNKIDTKGQDFDTDYHEAIAMVPGKDEDKGKVIDCVQAGYKINDKVIRHAKVAIGQ